MIDQNKYEEAIVNEGSSLDSGKNLKCLDNKELSDQDDAEARREKR